MRGNQYQGSQFGRTRKEDGFTLLEVILAISILTIGILAVGSMQVSAIRGNATASCLTEGTVLAADQIEKLMALPYADSNLGDTDGDGSEGLNDATQATADHQATEGRYILYWNVADNAVIDNTKTINVIVTWMDREVRKTVSLQNIIPHI
ncbi:MAG: prepilin-type N-terminal cleavage/methylation domain-containing protein [Desulfobacteraceae bacterium]|nr:prepilin-type N-terminal cleavage/methylation domain-containing protein [Desulfobacteraceae bacterium]